MSTSEASTSQPDDRPSMLWETNRYDGPLSGMALYQGRMVYFSAEYFGGWEEIPEEEYNKLSAEEKENAFVHEYDEQREYSVCKERTYGLYELSPEQLEEEKLSNDMFMKYVGGHCNHEPGQSIPFDGNMDRAQTFYEWKKSRPKLDLSTCKKIGVWSENSFRWYSRPWLDTIVKETHQPG